MNADNIRIPESDPAGLKKISANSYNISHLVTIDDITMAFGVRLHSGNPWVLDRLDFISEYYQPCPKVVVIDFGSDDYHAMKLKELCQKCGYKYEFQADFDVFSLAAARNHAFQASLTDFVFFCDPDFVAERGFFQTLAETATALEMRDIVDIIINPPAVHLDSSNTALFYHQPTHQSRSALLRKFNFTLNFVEASRTEGRFIAPYSNCFLINRNMFSLIGGYDNSFRGHGSEDFDFLLRFNIISQFLPLPNNVDKDIYSPLTSEFFCSKPYEGFRRLFELMSQPSEGLGLKVYHLHHPKEQNGDWLANNDWKREKFKKATKKYITSQYNLLSNDNLKRQKRIACLCINKSTWGYFLPLRLAGYELMPFFDDHPSTLREITNAIKCNSINAVAIFNPYMKSHHAFKGVVMLARQLCRDVIVIERGALPGSIYYDKDVCYNSDSFSEAAFNKEIFTQEETEEALAYIKRLREGRETLEVMDSYEETATRYAPNLELARKICFIPLQLEDDMAVTMFIKGDQTYSEFVASLSALFSENLDTLFIVKPHPLSKDLAIIPSENVVIANREDNVHFLLDLASVTICYNSGVGLLSLAHQTPTITLGNAFYNLAGAGYRASSASEGLGCFKAGGVITPPIDLILKIISWFLFRKYSTFIATDVIVDFSSRKSHGYNDICVTKFKLNGISYNLGRLKQQLKFSWKSYASAKIAREQKIHDSENISDDFLKFYRWGCKDFHEGEYVKSAKFFTEAFKHNQNKPILLRYAAEAHYRANNQKMAITTIKKSIAIKPIVRAKSRLLVFRFPIVRFIMGSHELTVPYHNH
jgi:predicted glycosyltransferase involved in capsule biosynthesis/capsule polysaccharide modification protein KpsS